MDILDQLHGAHWTDASERLRLVNLAIDEIERLREEVEHLHKMTVKWSALQVEGSQENQRLRGLLKNWVNCCFVNFVTDTIEIVDVGKVYVETRAALKGEE